MSLYLRDGRVVPWNEDWPAALYTALNLTQDNPS